MVVTVGIDPGKTGAAALLLDGRQIDAVDWSDGPTVVKRFTDWTLFRDIDYAVLERVSSMPKQGVKSTFSFGQNYGWWQGMLDALKIPSDEEG